MFERQKVRRWRRSSAKGNHWAGFARVDDGDEADDDDDDVDEAEF